MAQAIEFRRSEATEPSHSADEPYQVNLAVFTTYALIATLPVQALPLVGKLPTPIANPIILLTVLGYLIVLTRRSYQTWSLKHPLQIHMIFLFLYCCISVVYGQIQLSGRNLSILYLTTGTIEYVSAAVMRLVQLLFAFAAFEIVRRSKLTVLQLTTAWLTGTVFFAMVHLAIVFVVGPEVGRPGTFAEGNFGGLYYIISIFLALEFRRIRPSGIGFVFLCSAALGLILARSSISFAAFGIALLARQMLVHRSTISQNVRKIFGVLFITSLPVILIITGYDFGLTAKLLTEEVTPDSFSRIDRLLSIVTAVNIFLDRPFFGSGLQSYGFIANTYLAGGPFEALYDYSFRRIPNNVYVEIAADLGMVGLVLLFGLILRMMRIVYRCQTDNGRNILSCFVAILVYYLAFPTYTMIYVWVFLALSLRYAALNITQLLPHKVESIDA